VPLALIGGVEVVPFELPGSTELALACVETLGEDGQAVLLRNHGLLCVAKTIEEALSRAIYIEEGAQVALLAHLAGGMNPIPEHAVAQIRERYLKK
jgi:ribulose-5-phosphate 4-epimerase/fuculose-1-phosphate aldolase